jgi:hypothetical protein
MHVFIFVTRNGNTTPLVINGARHVIVDEMAVNKEVFSACGTSAKKLQLIFAKQSDRGYM